MRCVGKKSAFYRRGRRKFTLILHSQGGIEGGMILDLLLVEAQQDLLLCLEVYTFGCLVNHFSSPYRSTVPSPAITGFYARGVVEFEDINGRAFSHSEYHVNAYNLVSRLGVLNYNEVKPQDSLENRFLDGGFLSFLMTRQGA